ncbi:MAG TPA: hypothetical protein VM406_06585 [Noviherbaspirillum sp.]|nr:hypothetical protein [Noviherbaspirillum sp.]
MNKTIKLAALASGMFAALVLAGCAAPTQQAQAPAAPAAAAAPAAPAAVAAAREFYVVLPEDGRYYAFADTKNYFGFLAHAEVPLTRTRIGAGPGGKTVVFGISGDDVKNNRPSMAEQVFDGKLQADANFYGEVFKNGRFYVFGNMKDMMDFAQFGEVPYSFTDIGAGPKGETLVWVMNKDSYAKGRPVTTIAQFQKVRTVQ